MTCHWVPLLTSPNSRYRSSRRARSPLAGQIARLQNIIPWFVHNALIHYLSPRGLEQYSGGGWGTRDVSQGPVELLLAAGHTAPVRDLLLRVFAAQNPDGDWPQWFMFFERERTIRAGDSHGDIVFWPLLALAQYLLASGDAALLDERVNFFDAAGIAAGESATVWQHAERSLSLIRQRVVARYCAGGLRSRRLERFAAASRSQDARAHVQRMDRHAASSSADDAGHVHCGRSGAQARPARSTTMPAGYTRTFNVC